MSQERPDIAKAQGLAKALFEQRLVDFVGLQNATLMRNSDESVRNVINPEHREAYIKDPKYFHDELSAGNMPLFHVAEMGLDTLTVGDEITDMWCRRFSVYLANLEDIRLAAEEHPEQFVKLWDERQYTKGSAKKIVDLLLAVDALAKNGTPPKPQTIRDGISTLQSIVREQNRNDAFHTARVSSAESLEALHFRDRAGEIILHCDTLGVNAKRIPDYIPMELRERIFRRPKDLDKTKVLRAEVIALVMHHEPHISAADYRREADSNMEAARDQAISTDFLLPFIGELQNISMVLGIKPERPRASPGN